MIDVVFISDLHLNPQDDAITERFIRFIQWAAHQTKTVYILGDLFHVWPGDDGLDAWSQSIAEQFSWLAAQGVKIYYMHGNRDFLLGQRFASLASMEMLSDATLITLGDTQVLLSHGDRYCTKDKGHQWLRRLTRNPIFPRLFLSLPFKIRAKIVYDMRLYSQTNRTKSPLNMDVVPDVLLDHMKKLQVNVLIHGHTHKPGLTTHMSNGKAYQRYVLSDWDDNPLLMCYDNANGFYFDLISER